MFVLDLCTWFVTVWFDLRCGSRCKAARAQRGHERQSVTMALASLELNMLYGVRFGRLSAQERTRMCELEELARTDADFSPPGTTSGKRNKKKRSRTLRTRSCWSGFLFSCSL